jgi:hypothetical protein
MCEEIIALVDRCYGNIRSWRAGEFEDDWVGLAVHRNGVLGKVGDVAGINKDLEFQMRDVRVDWYFVERRERVFWLSPGSLS